MARPYSRATFSVSASAAYTLDPFAMWPAFPTADYYGSSAPSRQRQPATGLPVRHLQTTVRDRRDGSHVHSPTVRRGRRPAMPLQHRHGYAADFHRGLPVGDINQPRSPPTNGLRGCAALRPQSTRFRPLALLRGVQPLVPQRTPFRLASRTQAIWRCWPVPSLSGLLSTFPSVPRLRLPPAS